VVSFHGADAGVAMDRRSYREAIQGVFRHADAILARSDSLAVQLRNLGCPREKITVQRAGIPLEDWPFVERSAPGDGAWHFIQAGRLIEKKACDITLRAFASLRQRLPHTRLTIAGEGPLEGDLRQLAKDLGIAEAVTFAGFLGQEDLRNAYSQAHVFVHPSRTGRDGNVEGVPNTMLEAMATGLPVLATRHGGIPEAVRHERSGRLAQENDWETLAIHMVDLIGNPETWKATGRAAREDVAETFEQSKQIEVLESVYRKVKRI
jgi:glycosyltransferase involved in cell wall biosynthesis